MNFQWNAMSVFHNLDVIMSCTSIIIIYLSVGLLISVQK